MRKRYPVFSGKFAAGVVIYAVVFLTVLAFGLGFFWKFIEAYELSRPKNAVNAYMEQITPEQMCKASDALYTRVDQNLQSREQFDRVIQDSLKEALSYAKKGSESNESRQVYVLRCGTQVIGQFAISTGPEDRYGFRKWQVTEETFDFSHLIGLPASITVAEDYQVRINGNLLDSSYITQTDIRYTALEGFYEDYKLPLMVTYSAGPILGPIRMEVSDADGNSVPITEETDRNDMLPVCSPETSAAVADFAKAFIQKWVAFSASTNDSKTYNYHQIRPYLSSDGVLNQRLLSALDGFTYAQSRGDTLQEVIINRITPIDDGTCICDVSYTVRTVGRQGPVDTVSNIRLLTVTESGSFKIKTMERY